MPELPWDRLATVVCFLPLLGYVVLFLFRRETSLRPWSALALIALGVTSRATLLLAGMWMGLISTALAGLLGFLLLIQLLFRRTPLHIHAGDAAVRGEIDEACRRLFLTKEEPRPGEIQLTGNGETVVMWLVPQGGSFTLLMLPRVRGSVKLRLFFEYLAKRYPGPLPRIRVDLNRR